MRRSFSSRTARSIALLFPVVCAVLSGCATTQVKETWQDDSYPSGKLKNVLVLAVVGIPTVQRDIESQFAKRLRERGVTVTEGFRVLPVDQLPMHGERDVVMAKVQELGVDSLLLVQRDSGRTENEYIPGMTIQTGFGYGYGVGASAVIASSAPPSPTTQGYGHTREFLGVRTLLFDTGTGKIVFFMRTETRVDGPVQEQIKPYVSLVSERLKAKLFP